MSDRIKNINISINGNLAAKKKQIMKYSKDDVSPILHDSDNNDDNPPSLVEQSDDESDEEYNEESDEESEEEENDTDSVEDPSWVAPTSEEEEIDDEVPGSINNVDVDKIGKFN